jgi:hypothetical protein
MRRFYIMRCNTWCTVHSPRSGFSRSQDSTCINHCYDSANSGFSSKEGAVIGAVLSMSARENSIGVITDIRRILMIFE